MIPSLNRQIHLVSRTQGMPLLENFQLVTEGIPEPVEGEVIVQALYLSVDPYMRGRIGGRPSSHPPFFLNQPAEGDGVGKVVNSKHPLFQEGDIVCGYLDWADYSLITGSKLRKIDPMIKPNYALSVLGMPAMTAYFGLLDIGQPRAAETVVISAAAGAVGMIVGQIAKIKGCRVVGITGSDVKVNYLLNELGFDAAVNYKNDWINALDAVCPSGIDLYFDNVGGSITDVVMKRINDRARIILSGQISTYNQERPDLGRSHFRELIVKSATARGFRVLFDYQDRFPEGRKQLKEWLQQGMIKPCETIVHGLENMPRAFLGLFSGENIGKQLVQIYKEFL